MKNTEIIKKTIEEIKENELIFASKLYREQLNKFVEEAAYYKCIERLCLQGSLAKVSKGVYCRPKASKYGIVLPSEQEIINQLTLNNRGMTVGYNLYNCLKLTTQISKQIQVYSSVIENQTKRIGNIEISSYSIQFNDKIVECVKIMEVLQHFNEIEELDIAEFKNVCKQYVSQYDEEIMIEVIDKFGYKKRTIAFLKEILDYYNVTHSLNKYLSSLSKYKIPDLSNMWGTALN